MDALLGFPDRLVRQADNGERGQPAGGVDFNLDGQRTQADGNKGCGAGEHPG